MQQHLDVLSASKLFKFWWHKNVNIFVVFKIWKILTSWWLQNLWFWRIHKPSTLLLNSSTIKIISEIIISLMGAIRKLVISLQQLSRTVDLWFVVLEHTQNSMSGLNHFLDEWNSDVHKSKQILKVYIAVYYWFYSVVRWLKFVGF